MMSETFREIQGLAADVAKDRAVAEAGQRKTRVRDVAELAVQMALDPDGIIDEGDIDLLPIRDDGLPPSLAQNVTLKPIIEGFIVSWDKPPALERVKVAEVRFTPTDGGSTVTQRGRSIEGYTILGLDGEKTYEVEVQLIDAFNQPSGFTVAVEGNPVESAGSVIDFGEMAMLNRLVGLLPNENLATIEDATKIGEGVVTAEAMAVQDAAAFNLWAQNAMIRSAHIENLVADKIVGGTIETTDILIASTMQLAADGQIRAGEGTQLDDGGLTLQAGPDYNTQSIATDQKISVGSSGLTAGDWSSLYFYDDLQVKNRGVVLRADGDPAERRGMVALHATKNGLLEANGSARVEVDAQGTGDGIVRLYRQVWCQNNIEADNFKIKNSNTSLLSHSHGINDLPSGLLTKDEANGENGYVAKKDHSHADLAKDGHGHASDGYLKLGTNCRFRKADGLLESM